MVRDVGRKEKRNHRMPGQSENFASGKVGKPQSVKECVGFCLLMVRLVL